MIKTHVKTGQEVVVIAGNEKGKRGKVLQVLPRRERVLVEGINVRKKVEQSADENRRGQREWNEREFPIHLSNVMSAEKYDARRAKHETADTEPAAEEAASTEA